MEYKNINDNNIEIVLGLNPENVVLEMIARMSYELARPVGMGYLQPFTKSGETIDFSQFVNLEGRVAIDMDYVNGRQCKTLVLRDEDGKLIFDGWLYERDRGSAELFLNKVKDALKLKIPELEEAFNGRPRYWDRVEVAAAKYGIKVDSKNPRDSRLKVALALDKDGLYNEAIEIMQGRDFDMNEPESISILAYKLCGDSPERFYSGFADID